MLQFLQSAQFSYVAAALAVLAYVLVNGYQESRYLEARAAA